MPLRGQLALPGDKSLSHRALMLAALSAGECRIQNLSSGKDVESTRRCLLDCGIRSEKEGSRIRIKGATFEEPLGLLDCGNSGTTVRLLLGLLAGQGVEAALGGDASLSRRPMGRVIGPLGEMGAGITSQAGKLPLQLEAKPLRGITYTPTVASAQVKSAVLLAGLGATGSTTVCEPVPTRDHTERALQQLGAGIEISPGRITVTPLEGPLPPFEWNLPGDPSTGAFLAAAAALVAGSELVLKGILTNPTRGGFFRALEAMGARVEELGPRLERGERVADLKIGPGRLKGIRIGPREIPALIDELPILAVVATQAEGETVVQGAGELRVKESDRIQAICRNLERIGAQVEELTTATSGQEGFIIRGASRLKGGSIETFNDHRIAMAFRVAGLVAEGPVELDQTACLAVSCPEFDDLLTEVLA